MPGQPTSSIETESLEGAPRCTGLLSRARRTARRGENPEESADDAPVDPRHEVSRDAFPRNRSEEDPVPLSKRRFACCNLWREA